MASKGQRSKADHESRSKRQKVLEAPREPQRRKAHWDHVLEEMVWLSKDFESERKWKLAQAKKVALRASRGNDQDKRVKGEEQRLRKVALNISKDVKKFWMKIEKLVLYKHQLELDEKKKKVLDKQLEFLLGQTERYSTMLAENLVSSPVECKLRNSNSLGEQPEIHDKPSENDEQITGPNVEGQSDSHDEDYGLESSNESEDDEQTIDKDEALITKEEREEELAALQDEIDLPLEELLKRYTGRVDGESGPEKAAGVMGARSFQEAKQNGTAHISAMDGGISPESPGRRCLESNGFLSASADQILDTKVKKRRNPKDRFEKMDDEHIYDGFSDEQEDADFDISSGEEINNGVDDEATLSEEEELAKEEAKDANYEISLLQKESEIPIDELLARYTQDSMQEKGQDDELESVDGYASDNLTESLPLKDYDLKPSKASANGPEGVSSLQHVASLHEGEAESLAEAGEGGESRSLIDDAASAARSAQPTGNTFSTTKVRTKFPFLLKFPLREYQHIGLDWLVTLYEKKLNGILADEMGLGKTIMTIALLAHLACEKGIWGPHLIVVPTSVMLNWETEFLKWCPAFKILTYFGSAKERRNKRQGWLKPNFFHVCITTYRLVVQDAKVFKRKKWKYLILDEAHLIKNWKSQRWQTLLNFNSKRRILITGTPLQNDLMELWSLMHFLMPHIFQSHQEFKDWFSNPISGMVEGQEKVNKEVVDRLHNVLRPFILRRLKRDVEKQLPLKYEHVINCRLSKRQRNLYEDFIASSETQATLASSNFFGMISVIMQLRKVCNHPDLFEGRPIVSSFDMSGIDMQLTSSVCSVLSASPFSTVNLCDLGFLFTHLDFSMTSWEYDMIQAIATPSYLIEDRVDLIKGEGGFPFRHRKVQVSNIFEDIQRKLLEERHREVKARAASIAWWNSLKCRRKPIYSTSLRDLVTLKHPVYDIHCQKTPPSYSFSSKLAGVIFSPVGRLEKMLNQVESFLFAIPAARAPSPVCWSSRGGTSVFIDPIYKEKCSKLISPLLAPFRPAIVRRQVYFPDRRLIQFDCGKLQELAVLLRRLKLEGHRALIFTQMTKMLDILEAFINLYGYTYMRLDGSTLPEERQTLMQRFNTNPKIFLFILSTRSGGVGINLVGADTVIFYDSDWNPAMDQQAQDRCHRIGQTREVHIYRLISESTIEENILKKADQKRALDNLVIQSGGYNTEFFKKLDPMELFSGHQAISMKSTQTAETCNGSSEILLSNADVEAALKHAEDEADYMALKKVEQEEAVDNQEFTEEAMGKLEDDELVNEDDTKPDDVADDGGLLLLSNTDSDVMTLNKDPGGIASSSAKDSLGMSDVHNPFEDGSLDLAGKADDFDMIADVKEMATAAAASGQTILTFENHLRPIDRYAIRFLELWDPIIDKTIIDSQVQIEEKEWELDRVEKLKEDMEADIDDDEEPLVYERWDADFATEVYRQQVEALTQHQLMEELENEARRKDLAECGNSDSATNHISTVTRPKSKKKVKKAKFKSLKKGALSSDSKIVKEESLTELMSLDGDTFSDDVTTNSDTLSERPQQVKKRKKGPCDDERRSKKSKKLDKASEMGSSMVKTKLQPKLQEVKYSRQGETSTADAETKSVGRSKVGGKFSITPMPLKRFMTIKHEKPKKKGNIWSKDCFPLPDIWLPREDTTLCAAVHEYGPNWELVSEILQSITAGGFYRGKYRHPVHCCERFRDLIQKHVLSSTDAVNNDKASNTGSGKALLRVTEDNIRMLLDSVSQQPDNEPLIQNHFFALLSSFWRVSCHDSSRSSFMKSQNASYSFGRLFPSVNHFSRNTNCERPEKVKFTNSSLCSKLLAAALADNNTAPKFDEEFICKSREEADSLPENLHISLEIPAEEYDKSLCMPSLVRVSIPDPQVPLALETHKGMEKHVRSQNLADNRFRDATRACSEDCFSWASMSFSAGDSKSRTTLKPQSLGKHKLLASDSAKPSRVKSRKSSTECGNASTSAPDPQPSHANAEQYNPFISKVEAGVHRVNDSSPFHVNGELDAIVEGFNMFPHEYDPGLTYELDDLFPLLEFTDVG